MTTINDKNTDTNSATSKYENTANLNEQQLKAVTFEGKHLLVLAGAGTGKTKTIIERAKYLLNKGIDPKRIVILSFTRKSANEIVNRIRVSIPHISSDDLVGQTFHSWCMGLIKNNPTVFAQHDCTILDEEDRESCFKLLAGKDFKKQHGIAVGVISEVYSYAVNTLCSLTDAIKAKVYGAEQDENESHIDNQIEKIKPVLQDIIKKFIVYKKEHRYIDYDDILNILAKGLKGNQQAREYISSQFDHILIDETQDTNPLQYQLLSSFYENCHLFCVGDDAQSIYAFRGADFKTIHSFPNIVPDTEVCKLTLNYRSTQEILDFSNWLLDDSPLKYDKQLTSFRGKGKKPQLLHWQNEFDEADDIIKKIFESIKSGEQYNDNLVLSRSAFGLRRVEAKCIEKKIPYVILGGSSIMKSKHIRDVVSAIRIVANCNDELAWSRFLQLWQGIGPVKCAKIVEQVALCSDISEAIAKLEPFKLQTDIIDTLNGIIYVKDQVDQAIEVAVNYMEARLLEIYDKEWRWRKKDFAIIKEVAQSSNSIVDFINDYVLEPRLETIMKDKSDNDNAVILSTIHSAKGLEAKNCYIINASVGIYPSEKSVSNGDDAIEEERRCLYVALTRAKDSLYVYRNIYSMNASMGAYLSYSTSLLSEYYFLYDVPNDLVTKEHISAHGKMAYFGSVVDDFDEDDFNFD